MQRQLQLRRTTTQVEAEASTDTRPIPGFQPRQGAGLPLFGKSFTYPAARPNSRIDFQFDKAAFHFKFLPFTLPYPVPFKILGDERKVRPRPPPLRVHALGPTPSAAVCACVGHWQIMTRPWVQRVQRVRLSRAAVLLPLARQFPAGATVRMASSAWAGLGLACQSFNAAVAVLVPSCAVRCAPWLQGWLDLTYMNADATFRLSRGNKGTLFVLVKDVPIKERLMAAIERADDELVRTQLHDELALHLMGGAVCMHTRARMHAHTRMHSGHRASTASRSLQCCSEGAWRWATSPPHVLQQLLQRASNVCGPSSIPLHARMHAITCRQGAHTCMHTFALNRYLCACACVNVCVRCGPRHRCWRLSASCSRTTPRPSRRGRR